MTDIRAMSKQDLDELNRRALQWQQQNNPSQEGAEAVEPRETESITNPDTQPPSPVRNPVQMDLF
jgi:hypothetical protein